MGRSTAVVLALGIVASAPSIADAIADANEMATVHPGDAGPVLERPKKIEITEDGKLAKAAVKSDTQDGHQVWRLFYPAPEVSEPKADTIKFKEDEGTIRTLSLTIKPRLPGFSSDPVTYAAGFKALFTLFTLAILLESGLAILFNWRPFVENLNARAVRPLVSFAVAFMFASWYQFDEVTALINAVSGGSVPSSAPGLILTAMIIAGGSAGVNNLLVAFGYRQQRTPETVAAKPPPDMAWIAVKVLRGRSNGVVKVFLGTPQPGSDLPLIGLVRGDDVHGSVGFFLANRNRYPRYGGHAIPKETTIMIRLVGADRVGRQVTADWGPHAIAGGAVVDVSIIL